MKTISTLLLLCCFIGGVPLWGLSQCGTGYNQVTLNWDYLDFFPFSGNYSNGYLPTNAYARTQNFSFGTNRLTIQHNYADNASAGDNGTHTGSAGSYGNGDDIQFTGNGIVTLTFENEVQNLKFSMYDIDRNQQVRFNARNAANVAQNVDITRISGTSLTIMNDNTPTAGVNANNTSAGNTSTNASFNVDVAGPVKTITITISNTGTAGDEGGQFWVSDITACSMGDFPFNYYMVSRPFTGQPGYLLHALDKSIYMVNPANGVTKLLFTDPTNLGNDTYINSMGYDPYNKILYYVFSLTSNPGNNRRLRKYDFNTETMSDVTTNITTSLGIPTTTSNGVESGAAAFYNGNLYIGIEGYNGNKNSGRESVIWRIDFNASNAPYRASQAWAIPADNGAGRHLHDWSDFVINDGVLYDFDGTGESTDDQFDVYHFNLLTGEAVNYHNPAGGTWEPGQPGVGWNGILYNMQSNSGSNPLVPPYIAPYNLDGTVNTAQWFNMTSNPMFTPAIPSLGDGAEAFRPKSDFGDAPASYDPDPLSPATHERDVNLRLGLTYDYEWNLTSSMVATADGADEDAISTAAPNLNYSGWLTYSLTVRVFNNTGVPATLGGWLDYNLNGIFDPGEGVTVTVNSSASNQTATLSWDNIWVPQTSDPRTFLRLRITKQSNGMTAANMNGWYPDGEVEDFTVPMGTTLPDDMQSFTLNKTPESTVKVNWDINVVQGIRNFEILRSSDNANWELVTTVLVKSGFGFQSYTYTDVYPYPGTSYYRIRINYINENTNKFTEVKSVKIDHFKQFIKVLPNPATSHVAIQLTAAVRGNASIQLYDKSGRQVMNVNKQVEAGMNKVPLDNIGSLAAGSYNVRVTINGTTLQTQLIIGRH